MHTAIDQIAVLALATAAISVTVSKSRVSAPIREWIASRSTWLGELVSCSYCTSHWVAIALVAIYRPVPISRWIAIDLLISVFGVVAIAAVVSGAIIKLNPFHGVGGTSYIADNSIGADDNAEHSRTRW